MFIFMWLDVLGHDDIAERFRRLLAKGRLASTYLFVGPEGIGKRHFAQRLAECLLCTGRDDALLDRCGACDSCRLTSAGNHPDLDYVQRRDDRQELTLDLFIGDRDHRNQEGLCHRLALAPVMGRRRIAIIDEADFFNDESANALLKTLEEPPRRALIILIGTSANRQLPTIRSRSQIVRFRPLEPEACAELLLQEGTARELQHATELAQRAEGSLTRARDLADEAVLEFAGRMRQWLGAPEACSVAASRAVREFVESAGTEARVRRARLRIVLGFAMEFYRAQMRLIGSRDAGGPSQVHDAALDRCMRRLDRCLEGFLQLERYANQSMLIDCWWDDMARA
jgi:DNA polymerase-3 subunit delta'